MITIPSKLTLFNLIGIANLDVCRFISSPFDFHSPSIQVLIKLDIEGSEVEVVSDLVLSGTLLHHVDLLFLQWHFHKTSDRDRSALMTRVSVFTF